MAFINSYRPPAVIETLPNVVPGEPYDINFSIPLPPTLETPRVKLTPFIPSIHAEPFYTAFSNNPELSRYLPIAFPSYNSFLVFLETGVRLNPNNLIFAIIDKTKENETQNVGSSLAGMIGVLDCSTTNRTVEIGPVIILKAFQRTFVASNAIGAILKQWLNVPSEGGLGFRRVWWTANPYNEASIKAAERMGLKKEGVLRWTWCLPMGGVGKEAMEGRGEWPGRDSVVLSICWDDWEDGGKEHVESVIARV